MVCNVSENGLFNEIKPTGFGFYSNIVGYLNCKFEVDRQFSCFRIVARMQLTEALCSQEGETGRVFLGLGLFLHKKSARIKV